MPPWKDPTGGPQHGPDAEPIRRAFEDISKHVETQVDTIDATTTALDTRLDTHEAAWTSYTPTLTQTVTVTKTVTYAKYIQVGKTVHTNVQLTATSSGTAAGRIRFGLPVTAAAPNLTVIGAGYVNDFGLWEHTCVAYLNAGFVELRWDDLGWPASGELGTNAGTQLTSGDTLGFCATYEST